MTGGNNDARVMISCVTFETAKIVGPAKERGTDRIHLIHYDRNREDCGSSVYHRFYEEVSRQLTDAGIEVIEHDSKVYDYHAMLRTVMGIIKEENGNRIFINISAGTSEFSAAAMLAAAMSPGTVPFTVSTREYTVPMETIEDVYFEDGRPVGLSRLVHPSRDVVTFNIEAPDWELVLCLGEMDRINKKKEPGSAAFAIERLKNAGIWSYRPQSERGKSTQKQKEAMYFKRHYLDPMIDNGWIVKDRGRFVLTTNGGVLLNTFYQGTSPDGPTDL